MLCWRICLSWMRFSGLMMKICWKRVWSWASSLFEMDLLRLTEDEEESYSMRLYLEEQRIWMS